MTTLKNLLVDDPLDEKVQDHRNLEEWSKVKNNSFTDLLPISMRFNDGHRLSITVYSILLVFSAVANTTVLVMIMKRRRKNPSRINTMLMHLAIADLLVTFFLMPLEIGWASTVEWKAGDAMCRIMAFFRIFGLFLSSFILVCISVNRYYAILKPLHLAQLERREKYMLIGAWVGAIIFSTPQTYVFHEESHPNITWFKQCVTYHVFPTDSHELAYRMMGMILMYAAPLVIIIYCYFAILMEIFKRIRNPVGVSADHITRSWEKAKIRTLKMYIVIVLVFIVCWTPYYVMCLWYWFDHQSALVVDQRIQKGLFLFACTNSCLNPLVYGAFNIRRRNRSSRVERSAAYNSEHGGSKKSTQARVVSWKKDSGIKKREQEICSKCGKLWEKDLGLLNGKFKKSCSCSPDTTYATVETYN